MLTWFDNPPRRAGKKKSKRPPKGYKSWSSWSQAMRARKKKGAGKMAKRRGTKKLYGAAAAAHAKAQRRGRARPRARARARARAKPRRRAPARRRSWARTSAPVASRAGRQLRYRRTNPPRMRGWMGKLMTGAQDALWITTGKAVSRIVAGFVPVTAGGQAVQLAVQAASALAAGYAGQFVSPNASRMMLAGGLAGVVETFVKGLNIPLISPALGDNFYQPGPLAVGSYVQMPQVGMGAYTHQLMGEDEDELLYQ